MSDRFLSRWSRRKSKSRSGRPEPEVAAAPVAAVAEPEAEAELPPIATEEAESSVPAEAAAPEEEVELTEAELSEKAAELGLPDPATLGPGDDFSGFLGGDVPKQLKNLAMRKLWRSNPVLANVDGLVDYGEDFTDAAMVVKNLQTAYQVGRGYKRDEPEPEDELQEEVTAEDQEVVDDIDEDIAEDTTEDTESPAEAEEATSSDNVDEAAVSQDTELGMTNSGKSHRQAPSSAT